MFGSNFWLKVGIGFKPSFSSVSVSCFMVCSAPLAHSASLGSWARARWILSMAGRRAVKSSTLAKVTNEAFSSSVRRL